MIDGDRKVAGQVQEILSEYGEVIVARMGVPDHIRNQSVISVIVRGSVETLSAMTGKIGRLNNVTVKSAITSK